MQEDQTRYSRLAKITQLMNSKLELKNVLEHVVLAISEEIMRCDSVGIYLPQENGTYRGYVGKPDEMNGITLDMLVIDPKEDQLAKEALETRKAIYIPDTAQDDRPDPGPIRAFQIKSLLCVPIVKEDSIYGLVYLFDYGIPMNLTQSEIQSVEAYVNMAAVAISNANTITRKENLIKEKQLLLDVNRDLSLCSTMQEVLETCFSYVGRVLNNPNAAAHILDPIAERKIKPASLSKTSSWSVEDWKKTHGDNSFDHNNDPLVQEVIRTREAIYVPDVYSDPRPDHELCRTFEIQGLYIMPLNAMGKVLGTIPVANFNESDSKYTKADRQLAQSVVDMTALALSNHLFFEKQELIIQERTSELKKKNVELEKVVQKLRRLSRENELILNSAGEGIFGLDLNGNFTFCNPAAVTMLGYSDKNDLIGRPFSGIYGKLKGSKDGKKTFFIPKNKQMTDEFFMKRDGTKFPVEFFSSTIKENNRNVGYVVTFKDITHRKQMEEEIRYHAYYDSLTGLPNRVLFQDRLNQALTAASKHNEQLAVMFLDLDRFKNINDTLGHSVGDLLLQEVAIRLQRIIPDDCTVSRQGGDEFTVLIPNIQDEEEVRSLANRIIEDFSHSIDLNGIEVFINTSIGVSLFPRDGNHADTLLKNADTSMYKAKESFGGNLEFYKQGMEFRTLESVKLENDLYRALENDEFCLYYQPQIDAVANKIVGVEALIRWDHPAKGMISPGEFIPIAEETGLIFPIGKWILGEACTQMKKWLNAGFPIEKVSVNISAQQFNRRELIETVKTTLDETHLSPKHLELELTENAIIHNTDATLCIMKKLKELGIRISIDDFGTGYSSLGYLKNFPIDTLKIDQTFVRDIICDPNNAAITNTIIALARNLHLDVIAEGVESEEQIRFLLNNHCYYMQGYYFSRPIAASEIEAKYFLNV
ncbi:bifunctional diguanylate cyclase/phosphodiesterase [Peribacillus kribbensis]|uniref:bifunctional diguanylate cyclase/phosphodiesterase n=1 Tax=Peribacillus kribbensis TaxID=356658 RepID=UPI000420F312|nr:EAL domain-containing protein [Peribacillus kribbensis]